jgi:hypothetical protein
MYSRVRPIFGQHLCTLDDRHVALRKISLQEEVKVFCWLNKEIENISLVLGLIRIFYPVSQSEWVLMVFT